MLVDFSRQDAASKGGKDIMLAFMICQVYFGLM